MRVPKPIILACAVIILVVVTLLAAKDTILTDVTEKIATRALGARVNIERLSLGLRKQTIDITGLTVANPPGFPDGVMIDIPRIHAQVDFLGLLKKNVRVYSAVFRLKEIVLIKNSAGVLNVNSLAVTQMKPEENKQKPQQNIPLSLQNLTLDIGRVIYKDFSKSAVPTVRVYDINLSRTYKSLSSLQQLIALIITESAGRTVVKGALTTYGIAAATGVAALPATAASFLIGKDYAQSFFSIRYDVVYKTCLDTLTRLGSVLSNNKDGGTITGKAQGATIKITLSRVGGAAGIRVTVSARKYLLPQPQTAGGILYQITDKLNTQ
jgi:hypothetical protein